MLATFAFSPARGPVWPSRLSRARDTSVCEQPCRHRSPAWRCAHVTFSKHSNTNGITQFSPVGERSCVLVLVLRLLLRDAPSWRSTPLWPASRSDFSGLRMLFKPVGNQQTRRDPPPKPMKLIRFRQICALTAARPAFTQPSVTTILLGQLVATCRLLSLQKCYLNQWNVNILLTDMPNPCYFHSRSTFSREPCPKRIGHKSP